MASIGTYPGTPGDTTALPVSGTMSGGAIGATTDAAVTNPASDASVIAALKGLLTDIGPTNAAAVTNPATAASASANLKGILTLLAAATPAGENFLGKVGGSLTRIQATFARPADTTAYAVGDSVNTSTSAPTVINFALAARVASGTGYITKARLETDQAANVAVYRLHLFSKATPVLTNDNAALLIDWDDRADYLGYIDFDAAATEVGSDVAVTQKLDSRIAFVAAANQSIYGILQTKTAFTPASGQNFFIELFVDQN